MCPYASETPFFMILGWVWMGNGWVGTHPLKTSSMNWKRHFLASWISGWVKVLKNIFNNSENENAKAFLLSFSHFSIYSPKVLGVFTHPPIHYFKNIKKNKLHILQRPFFLGWVKVNSTHPLPIHYPSTLIQSPPLK